MIDYAQARQILLNVGQRFQEQVQSSTEEVDLTESVGRIAAEDIFATEFLPSFDNSAMDGFAIHSHGQSAAVDTRFTFRGCLAAGPAGNGDGSQAVEIMTGALLPPPYDTVIRIEDVEIDRERSQFRLKSKVLPGDNVRKKGEDVKPGDHLFAQGRQIKGHHLLTLASIGQNKIRVLEKPKIAVLSTGAELVPFTAKNLEAGKIRNSTSVFLRSWLKEQDCLVTNHAILPDDEKLYRQAVAEAFSGGALGIVSTGAVSVGKFDFVRSALKGLSAEVHFHSCSIRPGKPILFATLVYGGQLRFLFGLPGNPVATAVGARFFIRPFLQQARGQTSDAAQMLQLKSRVQKKQGLRCFYKAQLNQDAERTFIEALPGQASFMVSPFLEATHWVVLPEQDSECAQGQIVEVYDL